MRIGIIRETKNPPDSRVPITPEQCRLILDQNPEIEILVQPSSSRSYSDSEYEACGIELSENMQSCDILMGVKEVKPEALLSDKTYFFFSHTIKAQPYNKGLLQTVLKKNIKLVDYETIRDDKGSRVIAFGRWAGIVGAHNGILVWGKRKKSFDLKPMNQCKDFKEAQSYYKNLPLNNLKVVLTGTGRVAGGSAEVLDLMNIRKVSASDFLNKSYNEAVYCQLQTEEMFAKGDEDSFDKEFYSNPAGYHSLMKPYLEKANLLINGIYWDKNAPALFTKEFMKEDAFNIEVISDITCDIAPEASIPSTLKAATIADPVFGYDVEEESIVEPYKSTAVDMMTVDNLPNELPRDASEDFGRQFMEQVLPELKKENSEMIFNASITTKNGKLNKPYLYLTDYISD